MLPGPTDYKVTKIIFILWHATQLSFEVGKGSFFQICQHQQHSSSWSCIAKWDEKVKVWTSSFCSLVTIGTGSSHLIQFCFLQGVQSSPGLFWEDFSRLEMQVKARTKLLKNYKGTWKTWETQVLIDLTDISGWDLS